MSAYTMFRGDKGPLRCRVLKVGGGTITIDKAWFTAKEDIDDDDSDAVIALNTDDNPTKITIADNGTAEPAIVVSLEKGDTDTVTPGPYVFDFQVLLDGEASPNTVYLGNLVIKADVTRAST